MLDAYNEWRAEPNETTRERFFTHSDTYSQLRPGVDTRYMVNYCRGRAGKPSWPR